MGGDERRSDSPAEAPEGRRRPHRGPLLSAAEVDVLRLIADGREVRDIADTLSISPHTVKSRIRTLMAKLGATGRAHAVSLAYQRGILRVTAPRAHGGPPQPAYLPDLTGTEQELLVRSWVASGWARTVRERTGVSQSRVAIDCGTTADAVAHWESGEHFPRGRHLERYCRALRAMDAQLLARTGGA